MKKILMPALIAAAWWAGLAGPAGASAQMVTAQDPQTIRALLDRWGFRPDAITMAATTPVVGVTIDGLNTTIGFGGCTDGRACTYLVLVNTYTDVPNPPMDWINAVNVEYDNITVMRGEDGLLGVRASVVLGARGIHQDTLREILTGWAAANAEIADRAIASNLVIQTPAAGPQI